MRRLRNTGSIHMRKDGRWVAVLDITVAGDKRRRQSFYGHSFEEVSASLYNETTFAAKQGPSWLDYVRKRSQNSRVYFLYAKELGRIKIGSSNNVPQRIAVLQRMSAASLACLGTVVGGITREQSLHAAAKHLRLNGEWFAETPFILNLLAEELAADQLHDPLCARLLARTFTCDLHCEEIANA